MSEQKGLVRIVRGDRESRGRQNNSTVLDLRHRSSLPESRPSKGRSTLTEVADLKRRAKQVAQWGVVAATVVVLIRAAKQHSANLEDINFDLDFTWLAVAAAATTGANLLLPLGWRRILNALSNDLKSGRAVSLWCLAQTGRYLPTGLLAVVSRVQLAAKEGISKAVTLASIAIETAILLSWSLLVCALFVPSNIVPTATRWIAVIISLLGLFVAPCFAQGICKQLSKFKRLSISNIRTRYLGAAVLLLGSSVAARALGSLCLAATILNLDAASVPLILGAIYAAVVAGMVGITPAGLGVREGVLTAILASHFGLADAAAFALLTRAWEFIFEMLFLGVASWWGRRRSDLSDFGMDSRDAEGKL